MFSRASTLIAVVGTAILAAAMPTPDAELTARQTSQCNVGTVNCCNSVQSYDSTGVTELAGLLGIDLSGITGLVGLTCSSISAVSLLNGGACTASPVCCTGNSFGGLISLGCTPITL
ncbi:hypothetical protein JAAARDRAFT_191844 [Jaapia argillacea MUCL 33604]|uniref:Hydrophobin n=1 Tax=Jaapia argillacea MUCL 33604 TaxID=933084 RepID=A0A067QAE9_9AGAM|nr:hypothetical protein JAAARDRAFT_191844 [Jaapia argillacea MUCL 33604]